MHYYLHVFLIFFSLICSVFVFECNLKSNSTIISTDCNNSTYNDFSALIEDLKKMNNEILLKSEGELFISNTIIIAGNLHMISKKIENINFQENGQIFVLNSSNFTLENFKITHHQNETKYNSFWFYIDSAIYFSFKVLFFFSNIKILIIIIIKELSPGDFE